MAVPRSQCFEVVIFDNLKVPMDPQGSGFFFKKKKIPEGRTQSAISKPSDWSTCSASPLMRANFAVLQVGLCDPGGRQVCVAIAVLPALRAFCKKVARSFDASSTSKQERARQQRRPAGAQID
jgi:hypothetical protein